MRTMVMAAVLVLAAAEVGAGLDCARVKEMKQQGASAVEIARALGLTTPDVQACLAGVVDEPQMANPAGKLPLAPQRPISDDPIRRGPAGQNE
ncbi:MAG: hypothetical protein OZ922_07380 [Myxococcales bacterium]|nr:hypothetical protein [Myxococcales bacterium]